MNTTRPTAIFVSHGHYWHHVLLMVLLLSIVASAQNGLRSKGITLRYGSLKSDEMFSRFPYLNANIQGYAGTWISYYSRIRGGWFWEIQTGVQLGTGNDTVDGQLVSLDGDFMFPLLFGFRYFPLAWQGNQRLQPFISFAGGNYWLNTITLSGTPGAFLTTSTFSDAGVACGGGAQFSITDWVAVQTDLRYHLVNFSPSQRNSGMELGLSLAFSFGSRLSPMRVRGVRWLIENIYPADHQRYRRTPVAEVTVENTGRKPLNLAARAIMPAYATAHTPLQRQIAAPGQQIVLPVYLSLSPRATQQKEPARMPLTVEILTAPDIIAHTRLEHPVTLYPGEAWSGDLRMLRRFITPDAPEVLRVVRQSTAVWSSNDENPTALQLIKEITDNMALHIDIDDNGAPSADSAMFPRSAAQTLSAASGTSLDALVLGASLLAGAGIDLAFAEIRRPDGQQRLLLADTGTPPAAAEQVSSNHKRFMIRRNRHGTQSVWIALDPSVFDEGFETAWRNGALHWLTDNELAQGMANGWITISDIQEVTR